MPAPSLVSEDPADPVVGTRIERYRVVRRLGAGGMGTVYAAVQEPLGRTIALKLIHREQAGDATMAARFLREAKIASSLKNPHTVTVFDFGQSSEGTLFLATELLEGESLESMIERKGALSPGLAARIGIQVCRSLSEAHPMGIVHRDLKPENIFLTTAHDGSLLVKVLDYGLACFTTERGTKVPKGLTLAGTVVGTPLYMSPEQAFGDPVDHRSDLYSLGVILFQLLTGVPPFDSSDAAAILRMHVFEAVPPLSSVGVGRSAPPQLEALVVALLQKARADRPAGVAEVGDALREFVRSHAADEVVPAAPRARDAESAGSRDSSGTIAESTEVDPKAGLVLGVTLEPVQGSPAISGLRPISESDWDEESSLSRSSTVVHTVPEAARAMPAVVAVPGRSVRRWPAVLLVLVVAVVAGLVLAWWTATNRVPPPAPDLRSTGRSELPVTTERPPSTPAHPAQLAGPESTSAEPRASVTLPDTPVSPATPSTSVSRARRPSAHGSSTSSPATTSAPPRSTPAPPPAKTIPTGTGTGTGIDLRYQ